MPIRVKLFSYIFVSISIFGLLFYFHTKVLGQDLVDSDYLLDIQQGEVETANDQAAQQAQKDIAEEEQTQASFDSPTTELTPIQVEEIVSPEESKEDKSELNPQSSKSPAQQSNQGNNQTVEQNQTAPDENTAPDNEQPEQTSQPDTTPQTETTPNNHQEGNNE